MVKRTILHIGNPNAFKNLAICLYQVKEGHEVHFIPTRPIENEEKGIIYHHLKFGGSKGNIIRRYYSASRLVRQIRPDVVHAHHAHGAGWLAALTDYHPFILHVFGSDVLPEQGGLNKLRHRLLTRLTMKRADRIIVTGKHMVGTIMAQFRVKEDKITCLPRGVDLQLFRPSKEVPVLKKRLGITDEFPIIFSPRYLADSVYNIDIIIESIKAVKRTFKDVLLLQLLKGGASDDSKRGSLISLLDEYGLSRNVRILPVVENKNMPDLYNVSDICISVPSSDGFPVTVLEASGCCIPLIVSDLPYVKEFIQHGQNGVVVPVRDPHALADAIITLSRDSRCRRAMAYASRKKVEKDFDVTKCMDELINIYDRKTQTKP